MPRILISGVADDPVRVLAAQFNNLVDRYNAVLAKLDADAGVTDANYAALQAHPALDKIYDTLTGSEIQP